MAGINIKDISVLDYVKLYRWDIAIAPLAGITDGMDEHFKLRVTTSNLPAKTNTPIEVNIGAHKVTVDGKVEFDGTISMSCVESPSMAFTNMIEAWMEKIHKTSDGTGSKKSEIRTDLTMYLLGDKNEILATYILRSVSPQTMAGAQLGTDSEIMRPDITWNYEYYDYTSGKASGASRDGITQ